MRRPKKWVYFWSLCPGLGHLYLQYMNRGLQFMLLFYGSIFLMIQLDAGVFAIFLPVIYFYSFFDAIKQYHWILDSGFYEDKPLIEWRTLFLHKRILGFGLLIISGIVIFNTVIDQFLYLLPASISDFLYFNFTKGIAVVVMIIIGIVLIQKDKKTSNWE
ncbi:multi-TM2 domain-containing protein [Listeria fleischmannii 1991]|jgi:hypothetical protein|uniref:TM2 domain n=3 Tax=Listeria fleischmannii TaxID=1069827 RepID=A0A2X3HJ38_9LIST|nr:hypothetical protein [Listeria fleischmannii]EMG29354.1 multi-TM2 domain-containing protein [Listeria fleischmannii subsp. fleischmannii LU2006-1]EUJ53471.1 multi-TM2 domain-containing protein [Listeria fleischmannii FSL S10-1203]KMT59113.1 multi-TM2 domain-containing protein [Listeria fleischmannii 1991]MBC1418224.1 hypothetical protein [Listeria fleischmannii]SQC72251.1 Uncharacterised protein [Listeria fleischmannii subsp. fleischmannii]